MIKALISDSDGTLVNTLYLIRHGQYEVALSQLIQMHNNGKSKLF